MAALYIVSVLSAVLLAATVARAAQVALSDGVVTLDLATAPASNSLIASSTAVSKVTGGFKNSQSELVLFLRDALIGGHSLWRPTQKRGAASLQSRAPQQSLDPALRGSRACLPFRGSQISLLIVRYCRRSKLQRGPGGPLATGFNQRRYLLAGWLSRE